MNHNKYMVTDKVAYIGMYSIIPNTYSISRSTVLRLREDQLQYQKHLILPYKAKSVLGKEVQMWKGENNVGEVQ